MIARTWSALATPAGAGEYQRHFQEDVLPALRRLAGFRGHLLMRRDEGADRVRIQVVTLWESLEAVRAFAGDDLTVAVVEPAARAVLTSYDTTVTMLDVLDHG